MIEYAKAYMKMYICLLAHRLKNGSIGKSLDSFDEFFYGANDLENQKVVKNENFIDGMYQLLAQICRICNTIPSI